MRNNIQYKNLEANVVEKYRKESFAKLTFIQERSYRALIRMRSSLIVAPTGSGKTEAAIIPVICMISQDQVKKIKIELTIFLLYNRISTMPRLTKNLESIHIFITTR